MLSLWMARTMPVVDYGSWGLLYALQTGLTTFALVGILEAVIGLLRQHEMPEERRKLFAAASGAFFLTLSASAAVAAVGVYLFRFEEVHALTLGCVLASGALLAFASLQAQIVRLEERHAASLAFNFAVPALGLVGSAAGFLVDRSVQSFFVGSAAGLLLATVLFARVGNTAMYRPELHRQHRAEILRRLSPYVAAAFFGWLSGYGNNFVVKSLFDATEVARFTFALSLGGVMQLVASALNQVWSPRFFRIVQTEPFDSVEGKNRRFFFAQSIVLGLIAAVGIMILPPLLAAVGGRLAFYASMKREMFFIFSGYIFLSPWWHCYNYFLAHDRGPSVMKIVLLTSAVGITVWVGLMWMLGPLGVYAGFCAQMAIRSAGIVMFARGFWPLKVGWFGVAGGLLMALGGLWVAGVR